MADAMENTHTHRDTMFANRQRTAKGTLRTLKGTQKPWASRDQTIDVYTCILCIHMMFHLYPFWGRDHWKNNAQRMIDVPFCVPHPRNLMGPTFQGPGLPGYMTYGWLHRKLQEVMVFPHLNFLCFKKERTHFTNASTLHTQNITFWVPPFFTYDIPTTPLNIGVAKAHQVGRMISTIWLKFSPRWFPRNWCYNFSWA